MVGATSLLLLSAALSATPTIWLQVDVGPDSPCRLDALAAAIRLQRPDVALQNGKPPSGSDLEVHLVDRGGTLTFSVRGPGRPLTRELPPPGATCQEALQTAALMIDRYLDELNNGEEETRIGVLDPSAPHLGFAVGPSVVQAPFGLSLGLTVELDLRLGLLLLSLGGEANLRQSRTVAENMQNVQFIYDALPAASWVSAGVAPGLGPGRLVMAAALGLSLLFVTAQSPELFQQQQGSAADPYLALRVAYVLDLPDHFGLALRYEERWVPAPTSFSVEGFAGSVSVRSFSGDAAVLASYTFF
jgi:hypothetical protein